ncbi:MAG: ribose 5-phosphate isomerase A [Chlamydiales bacterium]
MTLKTNFNIAKQAAGKAAASLIENGMTVGLGTGSTAAYFIEELAKRCLEGLTIDCVTTSKKTKQIAEGFSLPLIDIELVKEIDITVDGADEIDRRKFMIKGGGGALLREKIVARASREMIVIVDESKCVKMIGNLFPLPIEVFVFGYHWTLKHLEECGLSGELRTIKSDTPYTTDNGNYIVDISLKKGIEDPKALHHKLCEIPGVIETGLFFDLAGRVVIGKNTGEVDII